MLHLLASPALVLAPSLAASSHSGACVQWDPPTPANGSILTVAPGQTITFTIQASESGCPSSIYLEGAGNGTEGMVPPLPITGGPVVSSVYSWTPPVELVGQHPLAFHAVTDCCASEAWLALTIDVQPPCPPCVNPALGLGAAGYCGILQLGGGHVTAQGAPGGILGDVCIGPNGRLWLIGSEYIDGDIRLAPQARFTDWTSGTYGPVHNNEDLTPEIQDALSAASTHAARECTQSFSSIRENRTITGNGGLNVVCVQNIELVNRTLVLSGGASDLFVLNLRGRLALAGSGKIVTQGVPKENVLLNVIGSGTDVVLLANGGGASCCSSRIDGTLLAPSRRVWMIPGLVTGEVISGSDISILLGGSVRCSTCQDD